MITGGHLIALNVRAIAAPTPPSTGLVRDGWGQTDGESPGYSVNRRTCTAYPIIRSIQRDAAAGKGGGGIGADRRQILNNSCRAPP